MDAVLRSRAEAAFFGAFGGVWAMLGALMFVSPLLPRWWLYLALIIFTTGLGILAIWHFRQRNLVSSRTPRWVLANASMLPAMMGGLAAGLLQRKANPWFFVGGAWLVGTLIAASMCWWVALSARQNANILQRALDDSYKDDGFL